MLINKQWLEIELGMTRNFFFYIASLHTKYSRVGKKIHIIEWPPTLSKYKITQTRDVQITTQQ